MNKDQPLANGEKHNGLTLARRPSGAVQKVAPGSNRILSGMVADALIVADAQLESWCQRGESYYYGRGATQNYPEAVKWFRMAAERGYAPAQFWLGWMIRYGKGVPQSDAEAGKWFRKAAAQDNANAQFELGFFYANGWGVAQNYAETIRLWSRSAEQGNADAQHRMGWAYSRGEGVPKDYAKAIKLYRLAAEQGQFSAIRNLEHHYANDKNLKPNYTQIATWFRKAVEKGCESYQKKLGALYADGSLTIEDPVEVYRWVKIAEDHGCQGASSTAEMIKNVFTSPEQFREAERRYFELRPPPPETGTSDGNAEAIYQHSLTNKTMLKYDYARCLLRKAAEMGHAKAMYECGLDYMSGDGFPQDNKMAMHWFRKAANQRHADAQLVLGGLLRKDIPGSPDDLQNLPEAYKWLKLAAEQGKEVAKHLTSLSSAMSSEQLQEGERRYHEFLLSKK